MIIKLFSGTTGWNNIADPTRLKIDFETGIVELAEALDVDIDDNGRLSRRLGQGLIAVGEYHSLFCDGGDCFVILETVSDAAIYKVDTNNVLVGVRSGLTKNLRMGWCQTSLGTYYSNGVQSGYITAGVSYPWAAQTYVGPPTTKTFGTPPLGTHLALFSSSMCVVNGTIVNYSEPLGYGLFDNARSRLRFASNVKMFKPVDGGVWASDSKRTYFLEGSNIRELIRHPRLECPAHEYSEAIGHINGADFGLSPDTGECAAWSCNDGLCIGTPQGQLIVVTKDKLNYQAGTRGATVFNGNTVINTIDDSVCIRTNLRGAASSKYQNYGFNSMVKFNGGLYGAKSDGLFQIVSGSTDNTTLIASTFTLPTTDLGSQNNKHLRFWYMGVKTDGKIQLDLTAEGKTTNTKSFRISPPRNVHQVVRTPIGRNLYGRYWTPKISNVLGSDFSIDTNAVLPIIKSSGIS